MNTYLPVYGFLAAMESFPLNPDKPILWGYFGSKIEASKNETEDPGINLCEPSSPVFAAGGGYVASTSVLEYIRRNVNRLDQVLNQCMTMYVVMYSSHNHNLLQHNSWENRRF